MVDSPAVLIPSALCIGRVVYTEEKCHPSGDVMIVQPNDRTILNVKYLYYYCHLKLSHSFKDFTTGIKPRINKSMFDFLFIVVPPMPVQLKIVRQLDELETNFYTVIHSSIDTNVRTMESVCSKLCNRTPILGISDSDKEMENQLIENIKIDLKKIMAMTFRQFIGN